MLEHLASEEVVEGRSGRYRSSVKTGKVVSPFTNRVISGANAGEVYFVVL